MHTHCNIGIGMLFNLVTLKLLQPPVGFRGYFDQVTNHSVISQEETEFTAARFGTKEALDMLHGHDSSTDLSEKTHKSARVYTVCCSPSVCWRVNT